MPAGRQSFSQIPGWNIVGSLAWNFKYHVKLLYIVFFPQYYYYYYIYICIYIYIYMQSWKQCATLVITTMALWQLMQLDTWLHILYMIYIYTFIYCNWTHDYMIIYTWRYKKMFDWNMYSIDLLCFAFSACS